MNFIKYMFNKARSKTAGADYEQRLNQEIGVYTNCLDVNALPDIFHYWSDKYVRPMIEVVGASNPDQFFAKYLYESALKTGACFSKFVSIGAGNCDTEVRVAKLLRTAGLRSFEIYCLDINETMLSRGMAQAAEQGVAENIKPLVGDFNKWRPSLVFDGAMANQSLHHVMDLEDLFATVSAATHSEASFLVSDMIGRNGHMRWPEALAAVHTFWAELPDNYKYNHQLKRLEDPYINWDCSAEGFEGIRAQDIVKCLLKTHSFSHLIPFANVIDVFVDRSFGHNFDAQGQWDREFIDTIHQFDENGLREGRLSPTHMLAVLKKQATPDPYYRLNLSPRDCIHKSLTN